MSPRAVFFLLSRIFGLHRKEMKGRIFFDMGSGSGVVCFMASAMSTSARSVYGIELDAGRYGYSANWRAACAESLSHRYAFRTQYFLPSFINSSFTSNNIRCLEHAIKCQRPLIFCNNYGDLWQSIGHKTQALLEEKLDRCKTGTVVVCLSRSFRGNRFWHEEVIETSMQRRDMSWTATSRPFAILRVRFYKYTRMKYEQDRALRRRKISCVKFVPFNRNMSIA